MAIIVKPYTFFPGTVIRSSEVNSDFDTIYTDYNGNITDDNISAIAAIQHSKLQTVGSAQILVGSGAGVLTQRTMSGDATISNTGVVTVTGGSGSTFNNTTLTGNSTVNGPATFNNTVTFSTMTPGSVLFAGLGGLLSQDNSAFFWDNTNNRLGIGTNGPSYDLDINRSVAAATGVNGAIRNSENASGVGHAVLRLQTGGAAGGDPFVQYNINGISFWSTGIDNSDNDNFKISANTQPGLGDALVIRSNGELLAGDVDPPTANYANRNSFIKAWCKVNSIGGLLSSYNVTSAVHLGVGQYRITWTTPFANQGYVVTANCTQISNYVSFLNQQVGSIDLNTWTSAGTLSNSQFFIMAIGDQ